MLNKATVLMAMSVLSLSVHAEIYHFNGVITDVLGPDVTYNVGDQFNFTIEIDFQSPGYLTIGNTTEFYDNTDDWTFYEAEYISGDAVENVAWDGSIDHYLIEYEPTVNGTANINVLNNLAIIASPVIVPKIGSWDSETNILFFQDWRNDSLVNHQIQGLITSFTIEGDTDIDGVADILDNCTLIANTDQRDTDGDGFGNQCDADFNQDCVVNFLDVGLFATAFQGSDADYDINGDGTVNFLDYPTVVNSIFSAPGPSGTAGCN